MKSFLQHLEEKVQNLNSVEVNVYHGTGHGPITEIDPDKAKIKNDLFGGGQGYFTDHHGMAKSYAKGPNPHILHAKLKMKHVFDVDHKFSGDSLKRLLPKDTRKFASHAGLLNAGNAEHADRILNCLERGETELTGSQVFHGLSEGGTKTKKARHHLQKNGYTGLRYNGGQLFGGTPHNVYIPYNKEDIHIHTAEKV